MWGGAGRQEGEQMDSFSSAILCTDVLFLSYLFFSLSQPFHSSLPPCLPGFPPLFFHPSFPHSFPLCCVVADGSRAAAAATELKPECEQGMGRGEGVVERRGGERRWGSGIWRAWLRGPLRGSVHVRLVV